MKMEDKKDNNKVSDETTHLGISQESDTIRLKRNIGLIAGTSFVFGNMVGSGIFVSPKGVLEGSGSVALSLIVWFVCGLVSLLASLCMAELGTLITKSGAEFSYLLAAFGPVPAFFYSWVTTLLMMTSSVAVIALTCAEYIIVPFFGDDCGPPTALPVKLAATAITLFLTWVNCVNVKLASRIQVIFTIAKALALAVIIITGIVKLAQGNTSTLSTGFEGTEKSVGQISLSFYSGMWAYTGWNNLNYLTEEVINPEKNLPRSIILAVTSVTLLYIMVNVSYLTVLTVPDILNSSAVAITWIERALPSVSWLMPIFVALSTFGATNGTLYAAGRLTFVTAREGHMMKLLSMVNIKHYSPPPSIIFTSVIAILMIIFGDILSLIDFFGFTMWLSIGLNMAGLIRLRFKMADAHRPYKVPIIVPIFIILTCIFLLIAPLVLNPQIEFIYACLFIAAGLLFYIPFVHYKLNLPGWGKITTWCQLLMNIVPEDKFE